MLTRDAARAEAWYRDILGLAHLFRFGGLVFFDCDGTRLFIREVADDDWRPSSILYFAVDDIERAHADISGRGVAFVQQPELVHRHDSGVEEWMAFLDDPDGNTLALMASRSPGEAPLS